MKDNLKVNIDIKDTTALTCEKCGSEAFTPALMLRKASRLLTGSDKDSLIPIEIFCCAVCGHINENMKPKI